MAISSKHRFGLRRHNAPALIMSRRVHRTMRVSALCVALLLVVSGGFVSAEEAAACSPSGDDPSCAAPRENVAPDAAAEASATLLARANEENAQLKTRLDAALEESKQWQTKAVEAEGTVASLRSRADEIEQASSGLSAEIAQLKPQLDAALETAKRWESKAAEAEGVASELRSKFEATAQATSGLPAKISELELKLAEALSAKAAAEEALEDFDRVITDAWLPHWLNRDIEYVRGELRQLWRAFVKVSRDAMASWGVLERFDEFYAKLTAAAAPHVAHVKDILIACYGRVVEQVDELKARWFKARDNVVDLIKKFKQAGKRRREHEAKTRGVNPDRDRREDEKAAYSREYWDRQRQRLGHLGEDASAVAKYARAKLGGWFGQGAEKVRERVAHVRTSYKHRIMPRVAQWRLALAKNSKPVAELIVAKYPTFPDVAQGGARVGSVSPRRRRRRLHRRRRLARVRPRRDGRLVLRVLDRAPTHVGRRPPGRGGVLSRARPGERRYHRRSRHRRRRGYPDRPALRKVGGGVRHPRLRREGAGERVQDGGRDLVPRG